MHVGLRVGIVIRQLFTIFALLGGFIPLKAADEPAVTNDYSPMWSPDGTQIVVASTRSGNAQIHILSADGSWVRQLTSGEAENSDPSWSPDGSSIAFTSTRDGNNEVYVMDADGGNQRNLSDHPAWDGDTPSWSPDGTMLTFVSTRAGDWKTNREDNYEIYVMNSDGSNQTRLTDAPGYDLSTGQAWTPDGKQIIFCSTGDRIYDPSKPFGEFEGRYFYFDIYRIDIDGSNLTRLTFTLEEDSYPVVSPDGKFIYYSRHLHDTGTEYDLYRMSIDGKDLVQITDLPGNEYTAAWSADGKKIVYAQPDAASNHTLWVADADGSNARKITNLGR